MDSTQPDATQRLFNRFKFHLAVTRRTSRLWFVPHEGNAHRPYALRVRALKWCSAGLIVVKVFTTVFLFASFPTPGKFAEITANRIIALTNQERAANGPGQLTS